MILRHKKSKLARKVDVGLVVWCSRKENAAALIFGKILLNRLVALPLSVSQVVAFVN